MKRSKLFSINIISTCLWLLLLNSGCRKAIEIGPSQVAANSGNAFSTNSAAQSVVAGIYTRMASGTGFYQGTKGISICMGLAGDELMNLGSASNSVAGALYLNSYTPLLPPTFWTEFYKELFYCNTALKGISASSGITDGVRNQLTGEVKFIRAFIYFYALNLYGNPPLTTTDDYTVNNTLSNSTPAALYTQILQDLTDADALLADNKYVDASGNQVTDRIRPNKQVVDGLLARVYLYQQDWKNAEMEATSVLSSSNYTILPNLSQVFLKGSQETLWALQPVTASAVNTMDANFLIVTSGLGLLGQFPLNAPLTNAFEPQDQRWTNWVGSYTTTTAPVTTYYYANKYKVASISTTVASSEYPIVMRLAEQYLIRAEARAQQNNLSGAAADVNAIRSRAGLSAINPTAQSDMLGAIYHERQVELFTEWGHRWFDLKRTGRIDSVMNIVAPSKGGSWSSFKQLMPIPPADILADPHLTQNQGYN